MRTVFITQSNYIPWKGYFDAIRAADIFIVYDHVQYTKGDWRNRNKIIGRSGLHWLTIPVITKGKFGAAVQDIEVAGDHWRQKHWASICQGYSKSPFFDMYAGRFEEAYRGSNERSLSKINWYFLTLISRILEIKTTFVRSTDLEIEGDRNERLISLCQQVGGDRYISGPAAKSYLDEDAFEQAGIHVDWLDYTGYPAYRQMQEPFEHAVSVIDLLFNVGPQFTDYMKTL
jgi:hypothetical protein